jgi:hypothetical protein
MKPEDDQVRADNQTDEERAGRNSLAPRNRNGGDSGNASRGSVNGKHLVHPPAYESKRSL